METPNMYQKLFEVKKVGIKLQRDTTAFNYKYATLSQIQEKLWEVMQKQWLLVTHRINDNKVITSIINTETDNKTIESVESEIEMSEWTKPQDKGSEITYYRRYNLLSLLDLEVEDDDGKKAQDSWYKEKAVDKPEPESWFNEKNFEKFKEIKDNYTKETAVKECRDKYKVSREWAWKIEALYN